MSARRARGSAGVTVVEAAFALPILLTFIFGLIDIGMWTFNANQATNAARDGARVGIIDFEQADDSGSAMHAAIVDAVGSRLEDAKVESVSISCVTSAGTPVTDVDGDGDRCEHAEVDVDSIKVDVEWAWDLVTPVAAILGYDRGEATGSATMRLVGRPLASTSGSTTTTTTTTTPDSTTTTTTTAPATSCAVTLLKIEQPSEGVVRKKHGNDYTGQLKKALPVSFNTNGDAGCTDLRVQVESPSGSTVDVSCGCDLDPPQPSEYRWSYDGSDNIWFQPGTGYMRVFNGATELAESPFTVQ